MRRELFPPLPLLKVGLTTLRREEEKEGERHLLLLLILEAEGTQTSSVSAPLKKGGERENTAAFFPSRLPCLFNSFPPRLSGEAGAKEKHYNFFPFLQLSPLIVLSSPRLVACFFGETVVRRRKGGGGRPLLLACLPLSQDLARFFPSIPQSLQGQNEEGGGWQLFWTSILFFAGRRKQTYFPRGWVA